MLTRSKGRASKAEAEANRPPIWALLPDELLLRVAELCFMPTLPTMSILDRRGKEVTLNVGRGLGKPHIIGAYNVLEANYAPVPFFMSTK